MAPRSSRFAIIGMVTVGLLINAPAASADPSADTVAAIDAHYAALGSAQSRLGAPVGDTVEVAGGAERDYQGGAIFYSRQTGAKVLYEPILDRYQAMGGPNGELGFPVSDETDAGNGVAHVADFSEAGGAAMYWSPQWGSVVVKGAVLDAYRTSGGAIGPFSYPSADTATVNGVQTGTFIGPRGTRIQWSSGGGLSTVPASLAATIPSDRGHTITTIRTSRWWWMPAALSVVLAVVLLLRVVARRVKPEPVAEQPQSLHLIDAAARPRLLFTHDDTLSGLASR